MSGDDRSWNDGDKLSFSERDRRRREGRSSQREQRPKGVSKAREEAATKQYLKQIDGLFSKTRGGAEVEKLGAAVRAAHGTSELAEACRQYRDVAGFPADAALMGMFLDSGDTELVIGGLEALQAACETEGFRASGGLRSQIRMLAEDPDDDVAELAEALVERL
ncbi:MAG: hypothetical protein JRE43_07560 [Deltaproteobacteria bacterium]|jgi:hypothetical protein|nr:hypothetical protein [Deltaproteobacteria bacterium]MBW2543023.1 hypothetical protein [Deltaproteobacteria bacterium]